MSFNIPNAKRLPTIFDIVSIFRHTFRGAPDMPCLPFINSCLVLSFHPPPPPPSHPTRSFNKPRDFRARKLSHEGAERTSCTDNCLMVSFMSASSSPHATTLLTNHSSTTIHPSFSTHLHSTTTFRPSPSVCPFYFHTATCPNYLYV